MIEQPQFRTVLRGFDPDQVTAALNEVTTSLAIARRTAAERTMELTKAQEREAALNADLDEAVARLAALSESSSSHVFGDVGTRVSAILSLADQEAGHLRVESERYADEVRRKADAEAARMRAAAVEAADAIVLQASQQAAAQREADAALHARIQQAEQQAAQIVESARREAVDEGRRIQDEFDAKARTRDEIERYLGGVMDLLDTLDTELSRELDDLSSHDATSESADRGRLRAEV
jgi:cell division septum initiation protein DivIVA